MQPHPLGLTSDGKSLLVGWAVLMDSHNGRMPYYLQQNGWSCQQKIYVAWLESIFLVLTPHSRTCRWWWNSTRVGQSVCDRYFTEKLKGTGGKSELDTIISRSAQFIDHCQRRVGWHYNWRRTVYSHNKNRKPRLVITTGVPRTVSQAHTWSRTFSGRGWKEQSLDGSDVWQYLK